MIPPLISLVKYDSPVLVSTTKDKGKEKAGRKKKDLPPVEQKVRCWCFSLLLLLF